MAGFRPGTSSGSAALPESGGGLKKPFDDLESGSKHGTGLISGVQGVFKEAVMSLVPPHIRRKGFVLPPLRSVVVKSASALSLPYFPWASMKWNKYPELVGQDVLAGLTVGIVLVPQGLAYAMLATLPPVYGLYAATVAGYVYTLFGTSGQLTIGPVALVSLFLGETFAGLGISTSLKDKYATYVRTEVAALLSLAVGILLCGMALFRIGSLMRFVSPSVLTGFVTGSGVYIFISQSKYMFGMKVPRQHNNYREYEYFFQHLRSSAKPNAMWLGLTAFFVLLAFNYLRSHALKRRLAQLRHERPRLAVLAQTALASVTLLTIVVTTLIARHMVLGGSKLSIVGEVPAGFNHFHFPQVVNDFNAPFKKVLVHALPIAFLTYMESVSVARKYAVAHKYALDMTQELWALGLGCLAASCFQAYPPGGSFSRTALKAEVGVKTPFANIVTSLFVTIVLVAAARLLYYVPQAVLGAIICTAVMSLFDFHEMWRALWVAPLDFLIMVFTFVITVVWNVELGLEYGLLASVLVLLVQISRLDMDSIGQLALDDQGRPMPAHTSADKAHTRFRALSRYPGARQHEQVKILHLTANLFFGNVSVFRDEFYRSLATSASDVRAVVVDANGVVDADLSSLAVIDDMVAEVAKQGVRVFFAGAHQRLVKALESYDLLEDVGGHELIQLNVEDVYYAVLESLHLRDAAALMEAGAVPTAATSSSSPYQQAASEGGSSKTAAESNADVLRLARQRSRSFSHKDPTAAPSVVGAAGGEEGKDERATNQ